MCKKEKKEEKVLFFKETKFFFLEKELISFYLVFISKKKIYTFLFITRMSFIDLGLIFLLLFLKKEEEKQAFASFFGLKCLREINNIVSC